MGRAINLIILYFVIPSLLIGLLLGGCSTYIFIGGIEPKYEVKNNIICSDETCDYYETAIIGYQEGLKNKDEMIEVEKTALSSCFVREADLTYEVKVLKSLVNDSSDLYKDLLKYYPLDGKFIDNISFEFNEIKPVNETITFNTTTNNHTKIFIDFDGYREIIKECLRNEQIEMHEGMCMGNDDILYDCIIIYNIIDGSRLKEIKILEENEEKFIRVECND